MSKQNTSVKSFKELGWKLNDAGELVLIIGDTVTETVKDELSYLDRDIQMLNNFKSQQTEPWLNTNDDGVMGVVHRPVFLEGAYVGDVAKRMLLEQGFDLEWLAQQGVMIGRAPMFGIHRAAMVYLAKTNKFDRDGNVIERYYPDLLPENLYKEVEAYPKSWIDQIWVWHMDEQTGEENWYVHPDLLARYTYDSLTEDEELAVMKHVANSPVFKAKLPGFKLVTGFNAGYGGFRYALALPDLTTEEWVEGKGAVQKSLWEQRNKVSLGFPRFLEK